MTYESTEPAAPPINRLLAALSPDTRHRIERACTRVTFDFKQPMYRQGEPIAHVYFPRTGLYSVVKETPGVAPIEVAVAGNEGFVGVPALLGGDLSPDLVLCQISGEALRLDVAVFRAELRASAELTPLLHRYTQALITMISQASACNRVHNVEERAARWLLMTHDRVGADTFPLTQEFLAQMLGVRRQAVNVAAGILSRAGLISYVRGQVRVLEREGLESAACECYREIRREFVRLLGWP